MATPKQTRAAPTPKSGFTYPKGGNTSDLRFSRKGARLSAAMGAYAKERLLPKLQARTKDRPECNDHYDISAEFLDACRYLNSCQLGLPSTGA